MSRQRSQKWTPAGTRQPIAYHAHYAETTYYFCSVQCRDKFQANPSAHLRAVEPVPVVKLRVQGERMTGF